MWNAIIQTGAVHIGDDGQTVEVTAHVLEGRVEAGMNVEIPLNRLLSLYVPITSVRKIAGDQVQLILGGEDREHASAIEALNFADEMLAVTSNKAAR